MSRDQSWLLPSSAARPATDRVVSIFHGDHQGFTIRKCLPKCDAILSSPPPSSCTPLSASYLLSCKYHAHTTSELPLTRVPPPSLPLPDKAWFSVLNYHRHIAPLFFFLPHMCVSLSNICFVVFPLFDLYMRNHTLFILLWFFFHPTLIITHTDTQT